MLRGECRGWDADATYPALAKEEQKEVVQPPIFPAYKTFLDKRQSDSGMEKVRTSLEKTSLASDL